VRNAVGALLIVLGLVFAGQTMGFLELSMEELWPIFLLIPALGFHAAFFVAPGPERAGLLVPGGILLTYGLLFFTCTIFGWELMGTLWPVFILGPAVGLFELYWFGPRRAGLLIPVGILSLVGFAFLGLNVLTSMFSGFFGVLLILAGLAIIFGKKFGEDRRRPW
jgi:hypothetical protein